MADKKYVIDNAELMAEWNWKKNNELGFNPETLTLGSNKKVWWKCSKGHEWLAVIANRNKGFSCPYCSGRYIIKGENDLQSVNPLLAKDWNYEKNNGLTPADIMSNSGKRVWWKCSKGHEWQATVASRSGGTGCPYCVGKKVLKGYNDLQTVNPTLTKEWNYEKNGTLKPENFTANSGQKVWWKCSKGHEWQATISNRNSGRGCPYCSSTKVLKGYNDLQTLNPTLAKEWNHEKNKALTPIDVTTNSGKKVWWKCGKGHEWQATITSRNTGRGCPYCSGRYVIKGKNDLEKVNPILAMEWHPTKNLGLLPRDVTAGSEKKVWWKCEKGHEWQATIASRNSGNGCPVCNSERQTSFPEYAIVYYLKKYGLDVLHSYRGQGYELDVYIPSKKIAIEYDGSFWHENKTRKDLEKNQRCKKDGIKLYRIREDLPSLNDSSIDFVVQKGQKDLQKILKNLLSEIIGLNIDVNLERDTIAIENLREYTEKHNSILISNPEIAREWNYEKNGNLKPEHFASNSNKKVWWKCEKGHEWEASIYSRNKGHGCPYCSNIKVLKGYNDLQTINPALAKEWNYEKNKELTPSDVMSNSGKRVWWKCSKGHEWQSCISHRNKGSGCPYCSGRYAIEGENDLQTVNPALANEWNFEKNDGLTPLEVLPNSNKIVWWKCSEGHEWQARIADRNKGRDCPICRKTKNRR